MLTKINPDGTWSCRGINMGNGYSQCAAENDRGQDG